MDRICFDPEAFRRAALLEEETLAAQQPACAWTPAAEDGSPPGTL